MKIAVFFPGIGYTLDKPLLHFSKALARGLGYEVQGVPYTGFERGIKGDVDKMARALEHALVQTEEILGRVCWEDYDDILFVSKSIGTVVAAVYADKHHIKCRNVYYTPVDQTFAFSLQPGIVFHGTADSWADTEGIKAKCSVLKMPLYLIEGANHSLEAEDVLENIDCLKRVMEQTKRYMTEPSA